MGKILGKLPQQRIRAGANHPTIEKLEQLFDYMDEIGIDFEFYGDRIFVIDKDRPDDKDWEIRDTVNNDFIALVPCYSGEYKLTQDVDITPRPAQSAPEVPKIGKDIASPTGLPIFRVPNVKKIVRDLVTKTKKKKKPNPAYGVNPKTGL